MGGGSAGHITPSLSVAKELKKIDSSVELEFVIDHGSKFIDLPKNDPNISKTHQVFAGKLRRYHGESFFRQILDFKTVFFNIRDFFKLMIGTIQALVFVRKTKPDIVFIKGGFVGVPVGLASAFWRIPYVVHDSDAVPGLANRIIGKKAKMHLVGMPAEYYNYPKSKTLFVGNPVSSNFKHITKKLQDELKAIFNIKPGSKVLTITGGSLGAQKLNEGLMPIVNALVAKNDNLFVLHQTGGQMKGRKLYENNDRIIELEFVDNMSEFVGAADVVIARGGAGTIAELAVMAKPTILVPNPRLTGGHQLVNTEHLTKQGAVMKITEEELEDTQKAAKIIEDLLNSPKNQTELSKAIEKVAKPGSAKEIAKYLLGQKA